MTEIPLSGAYLCSPCWLPPFVYHSAVTLADCLFIVKSRNTVFFFFFPLFGCLKRILALGTEHVHNRTCECARTLGVRLHHCGVVQPQVWRTSAAPMARQSGSRESGAAHRAELIALIVSGPPPSLFSRNLLSIWD